MNVWAVVMAFTPVESHWTAVFLVITGNFLPSNFNLTSMRIQSAVEMDDE
jgi:hypothetical protein